ncbi:MAG: hypothetical protein E6Q77_04750 [Rhizobium sp.]|nr:MAG: hypothetical protein E6Q77_04750 [Rhizobium sp.]
MSALLQGFLACVGAALFFGTMLLAARSAFSGPLCRQDDDSDCGAPEGDQVHFRAIEDESPGGARWKRPIRMR